MTYFFAARAVKRSLLCLLLLPLTCAGAHAAKGTVTWDAALSVGGMSAQDQAGLNALLSRKWHVEDEAIAFDVRDAKGQTMKVDTCDALFRADALNLQSHSYPDFKRYRAWALGCYAVRAVSQAAGARQSFVGGFTMDEAHVRQLPVELGVVISNDDSLKVQAIRTAGGSLGDYVGNASITAAPGSPSRSVTIEDGSGTQRLRWLASGDFDGDGNEDLLISSYYHVTDGSYASMGLYVVSRDGEHAPMKLLKSYPAMGPQQSR